MGNAALVERAQAGDRVALGAIYDEYADRLFDFCFRLLRDRDAAADAVQDTFVLAAQRLHQLRDPERIRPWLYAIARHVSFRWLERRKREIVRDDVVVLGDGVDEVAGAATAEAHAVALVQDAAAGLADRDRLVLELHERHGLDGDDLTAAMGIAQANPYSLVHRARAQLERAVSVLLVARLGRGRCPELDGVLGDWDGALTPLLRKRIGRHVDRCAACGEMQRKTNPLALLSALPMLIRPARADAAELGDVTQIAVRFGLSDEQWQSDGFPPPLAGGKSRRRRPLLMGVFGTGVVVLVVALFITVAGGEDNDGPAAPVTTAPRPPTTSAAVDATVAIPTTVGGVTQSLPLTPTAPTTRVPRARPVTPPVTGGPAPTAAPSSPVSEPEPAVPSPETTSPTPTSLSGAPSGGTDTTDTTLGDG